MRKLKVSDLMSTTLITLVDSEDLSLAEDIMNLGRIRHLPVVDEDNALVGLVTHRDLLKAQVSTIAGLSQSEDRAIKRTIPVNQIMQTDVKTVHPTQSVIDAAEILRDTKFGCLPVVEGNQLVGIVTEADFIDLVIRALKPPKSVDTTRVDVV